MKNSNREESNQKTTVTHKNKQPDIRDNLDSRKNEEYLYKGDDVTHNTKETKKGKKKNDNN